MENNTQTAGKTAQKLNLTEKQQQELIKATLELATTKKLCDRTSADGSFKRVIVFHRGVDDQIAVSASNDIRNYIDGNGKTVETICDPELFNLINDYYQNKSNGLIERIYEIYQEGGAE